DAHARASEIDRANPGAPYFAGCSLLFLGRRDRALPLLQRALDLDPRSGMAWLALGVTHLCFGSLPEARHAFTRACETEARPARYPCSGASAYVGEVMRLEGDVAAARAHALAGVESAERSDHAYRDTFRAYALVVLGRSALDEGDRVAARAAFHQVLSQSRGRPRTRSCGHVVVEALAGLARVDDDPSHFAEACRLFESGSTFNFEPFFGMLDDFTLFELATAADALGFHDQAHTLLGRARDAGSCRSLPARAAYLL
ncbi:MAG TPA: tetratricopeptide repeat protein, partial [Gemmatimonadaceae bacterium]|nr:tetratricopeptide repeat protein [Gemmatimonadaceae bacterium]